MDRHDVAAGCLVVALIGLAAVGMVVTDTVDTANSSFEYDDREQPTINATLVDGDLPGFMTQTCALDYQLDIGDYDRVVVETGERSVVVDQSVSDSQFVYGNESVTVYGVGLPRDGAGTGVSTRLLHGTLTDDCGFDAEVAKGSTLDVVANRSASA